MITTKITIKDSNPKFIEKLIEKLGAFKDAYVTVGAHEDSGVYPGPNAPTVVEVALWNEFGTTTIPERSFIRSAVDDGQKQINEWRVEMLNKVIHENWTVKKALETIGFRVQVLIQNKIKSSVPPPNADSTLKQKIGTTTLIDSGLLLRSIGFKVHGAD